MGMPRATFDKEQFKKYDKVGKKALIKHLRKKYFDAQENPAKFLADVIIPCIDAKLDTQVRTRWRSSMPEFPGDDERDKDGSLVTLPHGTVHILVRNFAKSVKLNGRWEVREHSPGVPILKSDEEMPTVYVVQRVDNKRAFFVHTRMVLESPIVHSYYKGRNDSYYDVPLTSGYYRDFD